MAINGRVVAFYNNLSANTFEISLIGIEQVMYVVDVKTNNGQQQRSKMLVAK